MAKIDHWLMTGGFYKERQWNLKEVKNSKYVLNEIVLFVFVPTPAPRIQGLLLSILQLSRMRGMPSSSLT